MRSTFFLGLVFRSSGTGLGVSVLMAREVIFGFRGRNGKDGLVFKETGLEFRERK